MNASKQAVFSNKLKSVVLILVMFAIVLVLAAGIGSLYGDVYYGLKLGFLIYIIVFPIQMLTAKFSILRMSKGVKADPSVPQQAVLIKVTENLARRAEMSKVPEVYVTPSAVPNAFASGLSEKSAFICVTQGLLNITDEYELSGVVGHELSHIIHRDILLTQLTVSLASVIIFLSAIFSRIAFFGGGRKNSKNNGGLLAIIGLLALLLQPFARLIAMLIELAVSRKREFAADAHSAELNGNSECMARALQKIAGYGSYSKGDVESLGGSQLKCMYINFPSGNISSLFSTHPPIEERIEKLREMRY